VTKAPSRHTYKNDIIQNSDSYGEEYYSYKLSSGVSSYKSNGSAEGHILENRITKGAEEYDRTCLSRNWKQNKEKGRLCCCNSKNCCGRKSLEWSRGSHCKDYNEAPRHKRGRQASTCYKQNWIMGGNTSRKTNRDQNSGQIGNERYGYRNYETESGDKIRGSSANRELTCCSVTHQNEGHQEKMWDSNRGSNKTREGWVGYDRIELSKYGNRKTSASISQYYKNGSQIRKLTPSDEGKLQKYKERPGQAETIGGSLYYENCKMGNNNMSSHSNNVATYPVNNALPDPKIKSGETAEDAQNSSYTCKNRHLRASTGILHTYYSKDQSYPRAGCDNTMQDTNKGRNASVKGRNGHSDNQCNPKANTYNCCKNVGCYQPFNFAHRNSTTGLCNYEATDFYLFYASIADDVICGCIGCPTKFYCLGYYNKSYNYSSANSDNSPNKLSVNQHQCASIHVSSNRAKCNDDIVMHTIFPVNNNSCSVMCYACAKWYLNGKNYRHPIAINCVSIIGTITIIIMTYKATNSKGGKKLIENRTDDRNGNTSSNREMEEADKGINNNNYRRVRGKTRRGIRKGRRRAQRRNKKSRNSKRLRKQRNKARRRSRSIRQKEWGTD